MTTAPVRGQEHWANKGDMRLFLWEKYVGSPEGKSGPFLFVHGSSMASQATFDLQIPGQPHLSVMDHFARLGYDTWCVDMEGHGRSDKHRDITAPSPRAPTIWRPPATTSPAPGVPIRC